LQRGDLVLGEVDEIEKHALAVVSYLTEDGDPNNCVTHANSGSCLHRIVSFPVQVAEIDMIQIILSQPQDPSVGGTTFLHDFSPAPHFPCGETKA
jgi:hypothetical protein